MMDPPCRITQLADELLNHIVSFLVTWSDGVGSRDAYQMPRSRKLEERLENGNVSYGERRDLDRFRLVCKKFMRIGTPWKFRRFVLRFSREGFQKLNDLLDMQLAYHTKYLTYIVRPFYEGHGKIHFLLLPPPLSLLLPFNVFFDTNPFFMISLDHHDLSVFGLLLFAVWQSLLSFFQRYANKKS
jgi:hypothetical protein